MKRYHVNPVLDHKIFKYTASRTKVLNLAVNSMRGGIRL